MSPSVHSADPVPLPYAKWVHILHTASAVFWLGAIAFLILCAVGLRFAPEELLAGLIGMTLTISATLLWCVGHFDVRTAARAARAAGTFAVTRRGTQYGAASRAIHWGISETGFSEDPTVKFPRQASVVAAVDTAQIPEQDDGVRFTPVEAGKLYRLGHRAAQLKATP